VSARQLLRLDAVVDAVFAVIFLMASWDGLYRALGVPLPKPAFYAQLVGAMLAALAALEWRLASGPRRSDALVGVAIWTALAAVILIIWLATGHVHEKTRGDVILWALAASLGVLAPLHLRLLRREPEG
jgi:peptidoglycan/LPS O-acetylase OafA/YrhL